MSFSVPLVDIAVIGGGICGCCAAETLNSRYLEQGQAKKIGIYEATDRIGGRLYSVLLPGFERDPVELGGMNFRGSHRHIIDLVDRLKLTKAPFSTPNPQGDDIAYLREQRLRKKDLSDTSKLPYALNENEKGKSVSSLIWDPICKAIPGVKELTKEQWAVQRTQLTCGGQLLKDVGREEFLSAHLSKEAIQLLKDVGEIGTQADVSLLYFLDNQKTSSSGDTYKVAEGFESIPSRLAEKFKSEGGQIHLNRTLTHIESTGGHYRLTFVDESGRTDQCEAKQVILTVPPTPLSNLLPQTPLANDAKLKQTVESVKLLAGAKLFLGFDAPSLAADQDLGLKGDASLTDLPAKNVRYWSSENGKSIVMAAYTNRKPEFWDLLNRSQPSIAASVEVVKEAQNELEAIHGKPIPKPSSSAFKYWKEGFPAPVVGVDPATLEADLRKPSQDHEIYIWSSDYCDGWDGANKGVGVVNHCVEKYFFPAKTSS